MTAPMTPSDPRACGIVAMVALQSMSPSRLRKQAAACERVATHLDGDDKLAWRTAAESFLIEAAARS